MNSPTLNEIYSQIVTRLRDEAGISVDGPSSVGSALALGVADSVFSLWQQLEEKERASSIDTAIGTDLDNIGKFLGVSRIKGQKATTQGYGPALVLKNTGGTSITVPGGIAVFPSKNPRILFRTLAGATVGAYQSTSVDVEAQGEGPEYNVAALALNSHNAGISSLQVYNPRAVDSGSDEESDSSYRQRLTQSLYIKNPGSKQSIRLSLATLPGVRDVKLIENSGGAGTFDVVLIGQSSEVPQESITQAYNYLAEYAPIGVSYRVILPKLINIDITCSLILPTNQESNRPTIVSQVSQYIRDYINSLDIEDGTGNGEFIFSNLIESVGIAAFEARDYTLDVSIKDVPIIFGSNYRLQLNERFNARKIRVN